MAGSAVAVFNGLVFYFRRRKLLLIILMALETKFAIGPGEQLFDVGFMRFMARNTLTVLNRLVFHFSRL